MILIRVYMQAPDTSKEHQQLLLLAAAIHHLGFLASCTVPDGLIHHLQGLNQNTAYQIQALTMQLPSTYVSRSIVLSTHSLMFF